MGHDITAYRIKAKNEQGEEVAYVRRGMTKYVHHFYEALGVPDYNMRVSGSGEYKKYSNQELKEAKERFGEGEEDMIEFFDNCIKEGSQILIYFG